jgi:hypothetical protein
MLRRLQQIKSEQCKQAGAATHHNRSNQWQLTLSFKQQSGVSK